MEESCNVDGMITVWFPPVKGKRERKSESEINFHPPTLALLTFAGRYLMFCCFFFINTLYSAPFSKVSFKSHFPEKITEVKNIFPPICHSTVIQKKLEGGNQIQTSRRSRS